MDKRNPFKHSTNRDVELKEKLRITVYGSYYPSSELKFLEVQRDFLIQNGYKNTKLVKDYHEQYKSLTPLEISNDCLYYTDVNFFIFTKHGKSQGATVELQIAATDANMADKVKHCVVFDQIQDNYGSVSVLSIDVIDNAGIIKRDFVSETDLQNALLQKAFLSFRRLRNQLRKR